MWRNFFPINLLFRSEVLQRRAFPLGDESYTRPLVKTDHHSDLLLEQPAV
jgi:hypothetical protein